MLSQKYNIYNLGISTISIHWLIPILCFQKMLSFICSKYRIVIHLYWKVMSSVSLTPHQFYSIWLNAPKSMATEFILILVSSHTINKQQWLPSVGNFKCQCYSTSSPMFNTQCGGLDHELFLSYSIHFYSHPIFV